MQSWGEFELAAPRYAIAARRLFVGPDGTAIGFLVTTSTVGRTHLTPAYPIFAGPDLYLSTETVTPSVRDLRDNPRYALHAFLGLGGEAFQLQGSVAEATAVAEREAAQKAIRFGYLDSNHPVFRLSIGSAHWVFWDKPGRLGGKAVRRNRSYDASAV